MRNSLQRCLRIVVPFQAETRNFLRNLQCRPKLMSMYCIQWIEQLEQPRSQQRLLLQTHEE